MYVVCLRGRLDMFLLQRSLTDTLIPVEMVYKSDGAFAAKASDDVDAAELTRRRVWIALVVVDASLPCVVQTEAARTRASVAARCVLAAPQPPTRARLLQTLVHVFEHHTHS